MPLNLKHYPANATKPELGNSFEEVCKHQRSNEGLGFILGNNIVCVDMDHCITDGKLSELAQTLYTEISQYLTGLHLFFRDTKAGNVSKKLPQIEIYSYNRYIAMTGNKLSGTPAELTQ